MKRKRCDLFRKTTKYSSNILQQSHIVQCDARTERANSTCTYSVDSQAIYLLN